MSLKQNGMTKGDNSEEKEFHQETSVARLVLKELPIHLKYAYLELPRSKPVIISARLCYAEEQKLLEILKKYHESIAWSIDQLKGISPSICMHKILLEENAKPSVEHQRRLNPVMKEVVRKEVLKWLNAGFIYAISDSPWVSPVHVVPKKGGFTVIRNEKNELIPTRTVTGWRVCIDYRTPSFFVPWMGILAIIILPWHLRTRRKPHSHALMAPLPSEGCHLGCAMLLLLFRGV